MITIPSNFSDTQNWFLLDRYLRSNSYNGRIYDVQTTAGVINLLDSIFAHAVPYVAAKQWDLVEQKIWCAKNCKGTWFFYLTGEITYTFYFSIASDAVKFKLTFV